MPLRPVQDSLSTDSPRLLPLSADDQSVSLPLAAPIQAARPKWLSDASDQPTALRPTSKEGTPCPSCYIQAGKILSRQRKTAWGVECSGAPV